MEEPSWSLSSYSHDIQQSYALLRQPPLHLPPLGSGSFSSDTEKRIIHCLHRLLSVYSCHFCSVIARLIEAIPRNPPQTRPARRIEPKLHFYLSLQRELDNLDRTHKAQQEEPGPIDGTGSTKEGATCLPPGHRYQHFEHPITSAQDNGGLPAYLSKRLSDGDADNFIKRLKAFKTEDPIRERCPDHADSTADIPSASSYTIPVNDANPFLNLPDGNGNPKSWTPLPALDEDERYVHVLAPHAWQIMAFREGVQYHVQWELERYMSRSRTISWDDLDLDNIRSLSGSATQAMPKLRELLATVEQRKTGSSSRISAARLSSIEASTILEVDREELSIRANDLRGVGNNSLEWPYGGRLSYSIVVTPLGSARDKGAVKYACSAVDEDNPYRRSPQKRSPSRSPSKTASTLPFRMDLCKPERSGKSDRLARRFGSRRILTFRIAKVGTGSQRNAVINLFVGRCFILFGRSFRALWAPADRDVVFAIETNEPFPNEPTYKPGPKMPSMFDLLSMYNHLHSKPQQAMAKWAARLQLLFSDSVPAVCLSSRDQIGVIPDIVSHRVTGEPAAEQILSDGAGLMSETLARQIRDKLCPHSALPCAVQMRISGAKGMLVLMSREEQQRYPGKDVLLRPSMIKAISRAEYTSDPSLLSLDVVRFDSLRNGTALTSEPIIAMVHGGVSPDTFLTLMTTSLNGLRDTLAPQTSPLETPEEAKRRLIAGVYRLGGVAADVKKRQCAEQGMSAKVQGLRTAYDAEVSSPELDEDMDISIDTESKAPASAGECLYRVLVAGFDPLESDYASDKLRFLFSSLSDQILQKFRIPVANSLSAFIVPDSTGSLVPDEIHVAFSSNGPVDPTTQCQMAHLVGDVLAFRSPCKLPTDVQKFRGVYKPELAHLRDCIVMSADSTLCQRSPASLLAGGDYDGDTVQLFWDSELVNAFTNAPHELADVPVNFVADNFDKEVLTGAAFLAHLDPQDEEGTIANLQHFLLSALLDDKSTGEYSEMHGTAVYKLGFDHPETLRLARMFNHVLDARKSGLVVKKATKKRDKQAYGGRVEWRRWKKEGETQLGDNPYNEIDIMRPPSLGAFIMDQIMTAGKSRKNELLSAFTPGAPSSKTSSDAVVLGQLWRTATASESEPGRAPRPGREPAPPGLADQLDMVRLHVQACERVWQNIHIGRYDDSTPMLEQYLQSLEGREPTTAPRRPPTPRTPGAWLRSKSTSTSSDGAPPSQSRVRSARMNQLAAIWRSHPSAEQVPLLCPLGRDDILRELKVACAAQQDWVQGRKRKVFMPFDLDFHTACAIKAKSAGAGATVPITSAAFDSLKPTHKAMFSDGDF